MSLATMKKKAQATSYRNHSGEGGFSLNSSRRVSSHSGDDAYQSLFRGTGRRGFGIPPSGPQQVNQSHYANYDPYNTPRPTNKNNRALLNHKMRWLNGEYPNNVVKSMERMDYETYMAKLHLFKERPSVPRSCFLDKVAVIKDLTLPTYETYQKTKLLENNCLPLQAKDMHYPPAMQCNSSDSQCYNMTYEEFLASVSCET
jgi:hypothetical protein